MTPLSSLALKTVLNISMKRDGFSESAFSSTFAGRREYCSTWR